MSTTTGPFSAALNVPISCLDPTANGGNSAVAVQVQNSSEFVLNVLAGGEQFTVQSFTATTLPLGASGGAGITVTPIEDSGGGTVTDFLLVWLLGQNGQPEEPPIPDGGLTSAAISALISGVITKPLEELVTSFQIASKPAGTPDTHTFTVPTWADTLTFIVDSGGPGTNNYNLFVQMVVVTPHANVQDSNYFFTDFAPPGFPARVKQIATPGSGGRTSPMSIIPNETNSIQAVFWASPVPSADLASSWAGATVYVFASSESFEQTVSGEVTALSLEAESQIVNPNGDTAANVSATAVGATLVPAAPAGYVSELTTDVSLQGVPSTGMVAGLQAGGVYFAAADLEWPSTTQFPAAYFFVKGFRTNKTITAISSPAGLVMCCGYRLVPLT